MAVQCIRLLQPLKTAVFCNCYNIFKLVVRHDGSFLSRVSTYSSELYSVHKITIVQTIHLYIILHITSIVDKQYRRGECSLYDKNNITDKTEDKNRLLSLWEEEAEMISYSDYLVQGTDAKGDGKWVTHACFSTVEADV